MKVNWRPYDDVEADKFAFLVNIVCDVFDVPPGMLLSRSRLHCYAVPRQLVATIWSENHSLQDTGYRLDRHHGAVIHARERIRYLLEHDDDFADKVRETLERLVNEAKPENDQPEKEKIA
jgi:chromosomal replication initiation ATPase DnaA